MRKRNVTLFCAATGLTLLIGIVIGRFVKNFPIVQFDTKVGLIDSASLLVTIAIGLLVPFLLKRWIDDNRQAKGYIIEELRSFLQDVESISNLTKDLFYSGSVKQSDKVRISTSFETVDIKLSGLEHELEDFYDKETKALRDALKESYLEYWKYLTGSELMSEKFKSIDESFYKKATGLYLNTESRVKDIIRLMYKG